MNYLYVIEIEKNGEWVPLVYDLASPGEVQSVYVSKELAENYKQKFYDQFYEKEKTRVRCYTPFKQPKS